MAKTRKKRDQGTPTVVVHYLPATPEKVAETRRNLNRALDQMYSEHYGQPVHLDIDWGEKPDWYGKDYVSHPDISKPIGARSREH